MVVATPLVHMVVIAAERVAVTPAELVVADLSGQAGSLRKSLLRDKAAFESPLSPKIKRGQEGSWFYVNADNTRSTAATRSFPSIGCSNKKRNRLGPSILNRSACCEIS